MCLTFLTGLSSTLADTPVLYIFSLHLISHLILHICHKVLLVFSCLTPIRPLNWQPVCIIIRFLCLFYSYVLQTTDLKYHLSSSSSHLILLSCSYPCLSLSMAFPKSYPLPFISFSCPTLSPLYSCFLSVLFSGRFYSVTNSLLFSLPSFPLCPLFSLFIPRLSWLELCWSIPRAQTALCCTACLW